MRPELKGCDNMSEISDGTTGTSTSGKGSAYSSREDLQELAAHLGLTKVEDIYQERFRVDRRKLERMLRGDEETIPASEFFQKIMDETSTRISWPARLKIGAKSKKDPHIRIAGRNVDVKNAKSKIVSVLDTKSNRVTMKLDVSYTDHSHIIGRGGLSIKSVMEDTGCHIHFPDSNRNNSMEKSNQVSIAGDIQGVEKARARVRELTPLIFSFELPIHGTLLSAPDSTSPYITSIQDSHNVQVMFRTRPKLHSTLVLVKGCEWEVDRVKEATQLLIAHMCENLAGQISVHMMMEISPQHHQIVLGRNNENLKRIISRTNTQILFPDAHDPNTPSLKKSSVTITGTIHNVYLARQQLVGSLPLLLIFDVPEESVVIDTDHVNELMSSLDVYISIRNKPKQNVISVIIKGIERNASNIYESRKQLLNSNEQNTVVDIPATYNMENTSKPIFAPNGTGAFAFPNPNCATINNSSPNVFIPQAYPSPPILMNGSNELMWPVSQLNQPYSHHVNQILLQHLLPRMHRVNGISDRNNLGQFSLSMPDIAGGYSSLSSNTSPLSSPCASPRNTSPVQNITDHNKNESSNDVPDIWAPGYERQKRSNVDYQFLKVQAAQAIKSQPKASDLRVPTSSWSGYGFSQSSPSEVLKKQKKKEGIMTQNENGIDAWNTAPVFSAAVTDYSDSDLKVVGNCEMPLSASNYLDCLPSSTLKTITSSQSNDLSTLLTSLGLDKYIQIFKTNEIDIETFQTLNESDLKEIGISAFGARRKILLSISELNKRPVSSFFGSAAPGAERKSSSSQNSLNETNW